MFLGLFTIAAIGMTMAPSSGVPSRSKSDLTDAQVLEIAAYCAKNPSSFRCR